MDRFEQLLHDDFWGDDYWNVCECKVMMVDVITKKNYLPNPWQSRGSQHLKTLKNHLRNPLNPNS